MQDDPFLRHGILGRFLKWEAETPDAVFLRQPSGEHWREYTWAETGQIAREILAAVRICGALPGDRIGLWSANCAQWIMADIALMMGGFVSVPLYANANAESIADILHQAECRLLLTGRLDEAHWTKTRPAIPVSVRILSLPGFAFSGVEDCLALSAGMKDLVGIRLPSPDDLLTIIYTSGTTGKPKGVMHTFGTTMRGVLAAKDTIFLEERGHRFLSYLPLSHAAERGIVAFAAIYAGASISFVESVDRFAANIRSVRPTHIMSVPRVWQKFRDGILKRLSQRTLDILLRLPVAAWWIRRRIRTSLGLQDARVIISGAAPIHPDLLRWFARLGIVIQEGYGLTEDFNVCSVNPRNLVRIGTTGTLFPGQDVRILPETREIIQRAPWIMTGYYKQPELTGAAIRDGYFYTGDTGELLDGYLTITGRVKDIFKTAKGEYIAPFPIESRFLSMPEIEQACVMGSRYAQPFVVVVLSGTGKALPKAEMERLLENKLNEVNSRSMGYQRLKKAIIVGDEWTIDNGFLTLTLKMKRNVVMKAYEDKLEALYATSAAVAWA